MENKILKILLGVLLIVGFFCSVGMLTGRVHAEMNSKDVACGILLEDVQKLAAADGRTVDNWLRDLRSYGVCYLIITDKDDEKGAVLAQKYDMGLGRSGDSAQKGDAFLIPAVKKRNPVMYKELPSGADIPWALVENWDRTAVIMPDGFNPDEIQRDYVKTLFMYDAYSYHYQPAEPASENENILFRAVVERGMRLIVVTPLEWEGGGIVSDTAAYADLFGGLSERLQRYGLTLGDDFSVLSAPPFNLPLFIGAELLLVALIVILFQRIFALKPRWLFLLIFCGIGVGVAGALWNPVFMQKAVAFGAAITVPCYAALLFCRVADRGFLLSAPLPLLAEYMVLLSAELSVALLGGLYVSALLSSGTFLFGCQVFAGVKVAQILPIFVALLLLGKTLFGKNAKLKNSQGEKISLPLLIVMVLLVLLALALLVLRSGDNMIDVSHLEVTVRNWLEVVLYARPRTKEMFMAFPVVALFTVACARRIPAFSMLFGVLAAVGSVSVINTFCHTFTPVFISFCRTLLGGGFGFLLGALAMALFCLLLPKRRCKTSGIFEKP